MYIIVVNLFIHTHKHQRAPHRILKVRFFAKRCVLVFLRVFLTRNVAFWCS